MMEILPFGDQAILINFEQKIDAEINDRVIRLYEKLKSNTIQGITFCIPAYCSLTVGYDINIYSFEKFYEVIKTLHSEIGSHFSQKEKRKFKIPVCYDLEFALDAKEISSHTNYSWEKIIEFHTQTVYRVFMMGFLPGFAYLGKLPEKLNCPRKISPRKKVAKGSVAIAGLQTGIYPSDSPGGWQILGKTPIPLFNPKWETPFLFQTGDTVQFNSISQNEFLQIEKKLESNQFKSFDWFE